MVLDILIGFLAGIIAYSLYERLSNNKKDDDYDGEYFNLPYFEPKYDIDFEQFGECLIKSGETETYVKCVYHIETKGVDISIKLKLPVNNDCGLRKLCSENWNSKNYKKIDCIKTNNFDLYGVSPISFTEEEIYFKVDYYMSNMFGQN